MVRVLDGSWDCDPNPVSAFACFVLHLNSSAFTVRRQHVLLCTHALLSTRRAAPLERLDGASSSPLWRHFFFADERRRRHNWNFLELPSYLS